MSTKTFNEKLAEDRRLCILRLLKECGGSANDSVLRTGLEHLGHNRLSRDVVRQDLRFLIDNGLVKEDWYNAVLVVTVTARGVEVAEGRIKIEGVKEPSPGI